MCIKPWYLIVVCHVINYFTKTKSYIAYRHASPYPYNSLESVHSIGIYTRSRLLEKSIAVKIYWKRKLRHMESLWHVSHIICHESKVIIMWILLRQG